MELVIIAAILVGLFVGKIVWDRRQLYFFAIKLPGPVAFPVIGNGLKFLCKKEDILKVFIDMVNKYSSPMRLWMGPKLVIIVKDPDQLQLILNSAKITTKAFLYRFLEPFLGKGLFTSSGSYHKHQRKIMQPLFSQKLIEGYSHLFQKHANKLVEQLRKHVDGSEFDISFYLHDSAFESAMDLLLEDKNDHSINYRDIPQFVRRFYNIVFTRVRKFWLHFDFVYKFSAHFKEQTEMKEIASILIQEIIATRVPEVKQRLKNNEISVESRTPSTLELITEMAEENPNCLTEQECIDHLMTFMATSQDTQSSAIGFTCMMLGAYPKLQILVLEELRETLGGKNSLDFCDLSKLKLLEMCIKESMRLYPVAPVIFRDTTEEFILENITIPKNVTVALSIYHVHRDSSLWEKPNDFYPEHFTSENISKRHRCAFIPFSAGPRKCVAQQYSYVNMKIILSTLLLNYEVLCEKKVEDIELTTDISIRPIGGYTIRLRNRL